MASRTNRHAAARQGMAQAENSTAQEVSEYGINGGR
jgi:hypothetical protein